MKLFFREFGEKGTPIIILHGLFGLSDNWLTHSKTLAINYKVYAIDLRNHGQSPHDDIWNYKVMAEDLLEFIEDHKLIKPILLGHSMGGKVIMSFSDYFPTIASKLIIVDIAPRYYNPHHSQVLNGLSVVNFNLVCSRKEVEELMMQIIPEISTRQFLLKNIYWKEPNKMAWRFNLETIKKNIESVGEECSFSRNILTPTLFIRGENSSYINDHDITEISENFSHVKIITISNAGHWVHADQPTEFLKVVLDFIDK